jgi:non-ribosomal peptide synthetase component F
MSYWRKQLDGAPVVLELPFDRPRPAEQSYRGSSEPVFINRQLTAGLKRLCRGEAATLYMTLLGGFFTLLYRYTRQVEILVGTPIAGRSHEQTEGLIGLFVNTLVMRGDMTGNPTFREFLHRVSEMSLSAYAHQDLPFDLLVEELHPERSLSYSPIIQVMFSLDQAKSKAVEIADLELGGMSIPVETSKFDLMLLMTESKDVIQGSLVYSTDLFDAPTISRMISHLERLLASIVSNPDARLDELEMLSYEESALLEEAIEIEDLNESFLF